jgi:hypothetical protein
MGNKFLALSLTAAMLTACQGQNPFKRESNPVRNYPRVARSIETKESTVPYGSKVDTNGGTPLDCSSPFIVSSNSPDLNNVFYFSDDSATSFEVSVQNRFGDKFLIEALDLPDGAEFKPLRHDSDSAMTFQLAWTPKNQSSARPVITLKMQSEKMLARCKSPDIERLQLFVEKAKGKPTVSVTGVPKAIEFGQEFSFKIVVNDALAKGEKPVLNALVFETAQKPSDMVVIDGSKAADCNPEAKLNDDGRYQFSCKFLSSALQETDSEGLRNSGKTAEASFSVSARSRSVATNLYRVSMKVLFKKVAQAKGAKK